MTRFLVHCHSAGRRHFDLRLIQAEGARSWSMLKDPPVRKGDRRLAIEREMLPIEEIDRPRIEEDAFGIGRVRIWDEGEVSVSNAATDRISLVFSGSRLTGRYELRRMRWYPGNRWLLEKSGP
jgi:bifunctional non-homologous end joining protein LigD